MKTLQPISSDPLHCLNELITPSLLPSFPLSFLLHADRQLLPKVIMGHNSPLSNAYPGTAPCIYLATVLQDCCSTVLYCSTVLSTFFIIFFFSYQCITIIMHAISFLNHSNSPPFLIFCNLREKFDLLSHCNNTYCLSPVFRNPFW